MVSDEDDDVDDEFEEGFSDAGSRRVAQYPNFLMVAGIIWMGSGALNLVSSFFKLSQAGNQAGVCCGGLIGIGLLVCGFQVVTGRGSGVWVMVGAILSLLFGLLQAFCGTYVVLGGGMPGGAGNNGGVPVNLLNDAALVVGIIVLVLGLTLILSGVLALAGRNSYFAWKEDSETRFRERSREKDEVDADEEDVDDREDRLRGR
jgi:hypothetical protein